MEIPTNLIAFYNAFVKRGKGVSTDTRTIQEGQVYIALKGDRFDGNLYVDKALENGALAVITSDPKWAAEPVCLVVEDTLLALQQLARHHRNRFYFPVLGITGSNGKTTTKELIAAALQEQYNVHFTQGNLNNHIGVPLTLLQMKTDADIAVIEMGANKVGDIAELCAIAAPTHGIITNIGKAHLKGFGSLEGVKKAKSELYDWLKDNDGVAFVDLDEPHLSALAKGVRTIGFYTNPNPSVTIMETEIELEALYPTITASFNIDERRYQVQTELFGEHNFKNVKAAITISKYFKVRGSKIAKGLASYIPKNNRSQIDTWGIHTVLKDAYNANPTSMRASISSFKLIETDLPKVLILGDMLELGDEEQAEHQTLVTELQTQGWDKVFLVGAIFKTTTFPATMQCVEQVEDLKPLLESTIKKPSFFLIKGSRGLALERILTPSDTL